MQFIYIFKKEKCNFKCNCVPGAGGGGAGLDSGSTFGAGFGGESSGETRHIHFESFEVNFIFNAGIHKTNAFQLTLLI